MTYNQCLLGFLIGCVITVIILFTLYVLLKFRSKPMDPEPSREMPDAGNDSE